MKYQEAIENLKYLISGDCTDNQMDFVEEIEMAINALEKQIPKKPTPYKGFEGKCTCCGVIFLDRSTNYCGNCGQALDWRDTE